MLLVFCLVFNPMGVRDGIKDFFRGDPVGSAAEDSDPAWRLVLVNSNNLWEKDPDIKLKYLSNGLAVDRRMYPDLQEMMDDARAAGLSPVICSAYRTVKDQEEIFDRRVERSIEEGMPREEAEAEAAKWVAYPGTSEHHTGLAVDIVSLDYQVLDSGQENTPEQRWLMENSWKYGFILRYPSGKSHITGISYEPWHYRYVGRDVAEEIFFSGLTLEEYLEENR
ncbi:MAG: M15 family metallopeptidase [Clostridia bacterium]|nr:M15 family metallopeptidase [Clostridia bacterium]